MVAVQVRQHDSVERIEIDGRALQRHQRRRAAVDEEAAVGAAHQEAGIEPAAAAEGVTAADEGQLHALFRQPHARTQAAMRRIVERDLAAVDTHHVARDGKSQASAPGFRIA